MIFSFTQRQPVTQKISTPKCLPSQEISLIHLNLQVTSLIQTAHPTRRGRLHKDWTIQEELLPDPGHCRAAKPGLKAQLQPGHLPTCQHTTTDTLGGVDVLKDTP